MTTQNLLVELFVEELPPKALKKLGESFAGVLADQLMVQGLTSADTVVTPYASPRRLAAHISHVWLKAGETIVAGTYQAIRELKDGALIRTAKPEDKKPQATGKAS